MRMDGNAHSYFRITLFMLLLSIFFILMPSLTFAERFVKIYSTIDKNKIGINQTLTLSVTIEAKNISKVLEPTLPDIKDFKIINRSSSTSTEISFINGKTSRVKKYQYQYTLKPEKIGKFIIGPIFSTYKGKQYKTEPIEITITEKNSSSDNGYITDEGIQINPEKIKKEIFLKYLTTKKNVYVGQQIFLKYEIYSPYEIERISLVSMPEMEGFYKIDLQNSTKLKYNSLMLGGKNYKYAILKKIVLFPLFSGNFNISPLQVKVTVLIRSTEFPNFFALPYTLILSSPKLAINVNPLPKYRGKGKFSGVVGSLRINAVQYSKEIYLGEPSKFYIILKSNGNLNNIKRFTFNSSPKSRIILSGVYNDKKMTNNGYYFTKKFEYTVIPEKTGNLFIKIDKITYFDIDKNRYISLNTGAFSFDVKTISSSDNNKSSEKSRGSLYTSKQINSKLKMLLILIIFFFLILIVVLVYLLLKVKKSQHKIQREIIERDSEKNEVLRNIRLLMAEAESKLLSGNNILEASSLLKKALIIALSEKMGISAGKVTIKNIDNSNLDQNLKKDLKDSINFLNKIIYSQERESIIDDKEKLNMYIEKVNELIKKLGINGFNQ